MRFIPMSINQGKQAVNWLLNKMKILPLLKQPSTLLMSKPNFKSLKTLFAGIRITLKFLIPFLFVLLTACQSVQVKQTVKHPEAPCKVVDGSIPAKCMAIYLERYKAAVNACNGAP